MPFSSIGRRLAGSALMLALALGCGCRASAPERVALGAGTYAARKYVGSLPFWEGPESYGAGFARSPHAFAVSTGRDMEGLVAEIRREDGRIHIAADVLSGSIEVQALDGLGNVVYFRRHLNAKGDLYDLENDKLYLANLRQGTATRALDLPTHNGARLTVVCGVSGRFVAWMNTSGGLVARTFAAAPVAAPTEEPQTWPPFWCAADDRCAAVVFDHGGDPPHLRTNCEGRVVEEALETHWPTSTIVHPQGTLASFDSKNRQSTVTVRLPGGPARTFPVTGTAYAATYWDRRTVLLHVAAGAADQPTHLLIVTVDAERGPQAEWDLDFARSRTDRRSLPDLVLLPSSGNGRPLVARLDDDLVLITGTGEVWTWQGGGATR